MKFVSSQSPKRRPAGLADRLGYCFIGINQRSRDNTFCGAWLACASIAVAAC